MYVTNTADRTCFICNSSIFLVWVAPEVESEAETSERHSLLLELSVRL